MGQDLLGDTPCRDTPPSDCAPLPIPPLPALWHPFRLRVSPDAEHVDQQTVAWAQRFGLISGRDVDRFRTAAYGQLTARTYPYAPIEELQWVTDWCTWLFAFDDAVCEPSAAGHLARLLPTCLAALETPTRAHPAVDPVVRAFADALTDLCERLTILATGEQVDRWCTATREYLYAQVWEAANRDAGVVPSLEDYIMMRRLTGAMYTVYAVIDVAARSPLTAEEWSDPLVCQVRDAAVDAVCWDNDIFSYAKEAAQANSANNLVSVLTTRGAPLPQAVETIVEMRNQAVATIRDGGGILAAERSPAVAAYVAGLEHWISGSIAYSEVSSRYRITQDGPDISRP